MERIRPVLAVFAVVVASCGGTISSSSCAEYSAEVQDMIASGASVDDLSNFMSDTEEHAARLIANDRDNAGPCVEAVLGAMLTGAFDDLYLSSDE
ncbi:MAG: hypothetical protein WBN24_04020 [Acidimicrobiia bacterium]